MLISGSSFLLLPLEGKIHFSSCLSEKSVQIKEENGSFKINDANESKQAACGCC